MDRKHPKELYILAFAELCERFAFWGVGNLLVLYLVQYYHFSDVKATHIYGIFSGFATALPLIGGFITDRWNYHMPLILGTLLNSLSCFFIAIGTTQFLYLGLGLIAIGYGIFTPAILTLLGHSYHDKTNLREAGFSLYYASINVGVFLAMISLGYVANRISWSAAFILAGLVQILGMVPILWYIFKHHHKVKLFHPTKQTSLTTSLNRQQKNRLIVIFTLSFFSFVFWIPYIQGTSSMALFSLNYTNRMIGSFQLPPAWLISFESFFLILLAPILAKFYGYLQKKHLDPSPATKTGLSLLSISVCFLIMLAATSTISSHIEHAMKSPFYLISAYFFMALGEMLLAPVGLSLITHLSPRKYTAFLVGFWYVCVGLSFYIGGYLAGYMQQLKSLFDFFSIFVFIAAIPGIFLLLLSKKLTQLAQKP